METSPEIPIPFKPGDVLRNINKSIKALYIVLASDSSGCFVDQVRWKGSNFVRDNNGVSQFFIYPEDYEYYELYSRSNENSNYNPN